MKSSRKIKIQAHFISSDKQMLELLFPMCTKHLLRACVCVCFRVFFLLFKPKKYAFFSTTCFVRTGFCTDIQSKELTQSYHKAGDSSLSIHEHFHVSILLHNCIYLCKTHMNKHFPCLQSLPNTVEIT